MVQSGRGRLPPPGRPGGGGQGDGADLKASTAFIPRVADALAFALEKNILVEVGIGKGDSPGSETFFCLRGSFPLSTLRFSTL